MLCSRSRYCHSKISYREIKEIEIERNVKALRALKPSRSKILGSMYFFTNFYHINPAIEISQRLNSVAKYNIIRVSPLFKKERKIKTDAIRPKLVRSHMNRKMCFLFITRNRYASKRLVNSNLRFFVSL